MILWLAISAVVVVNGMFLWRLGCAVVEDRRHGRELHERHVRRLRDACYRNGVEN